MDLLKIKTFGALKKAGYRPRSVKEELRDNLIAKIRSGKPAFEGIIGFEDSVLPDIETAILSRHNILLLGLRGQAKTRIARQMVHLLDEYIPYISGSEIADDPFNPISWYGRNELAEKGDDTPVSWMSREERYTEKLATPDVTVADLIGDVDPIKAATLKLPYSDERVIHFGLVPRAHRGIFVINELPDLQSRIQVSLFNILQESDIQIRGFKLRMPLDIQFVFTANPEDYTNRGSIVTPLKDRIESQILTHYPKSVAVSRKITEQEAIIHQEQESRIKVHDLLKDLIEQIAFQARDSEYIDKKSGVSARLTISAYENLVSTAERRLLLNGESSGHARVSDLLGVLQAITGKIELVYEGEQEGPAKVAHILIGKAIKALAPEYLPDPEKSRKSKTGNPYKAILDWFGNGHALSLPYHLSTKEYSANLKKVPGLSRLINRLYPKADKDTKILFMELALHALSEHSMLSKHYQETEFEFKDMFESLFSAGINNDDEDDFDEDRLI